MIWDDSRWPNFSRAEFCCRHTGHCSMDPVFLDCLQALRSRLGTALVIYSGYRDQTHPVETRKPRPGSHCSGKAADIHCLAKDRYPLLAAALACGFTGVGIAPTFIHLDLCGAEFHAPRPLVWTY